MRKIPIRNIIAGIGIGMMIVSTFNIVYNYISKQDQNITTIQNNPINPPADFVENHSSDKESGDELAVESDIVTEILSDHVIYIKKGMSSEQIARYLEKEGIIIDAIEFNRLIVELNLSNKLRFGEKTIPPGSSIDDIINILIKPN